mgnify:CR=1 FL=1
MSQSTALYETDFHAWAQRQAALLRQGNYEQLDAQHLLEEIEDMAGSQRRALASRLQVLISYLLKWEHQPELRSRSWMATIRVQRAEIADLLVDNPSLRPQLAMFVERAWPKAREFAWAETGLPLAAFPVECSYAVEQILDPSFPVGISEQAS